ncbi:MAG: peptide chain release factor N(5)-glutamine methyltransferase [Paracoccaceae bacterium]|nr:peptide chain release factor N(5)-glutamine methyltransferase [Paracoccaceae bacterium]
MTVAEAVAEAIGQLHDAGIKGAQRDARALTAFALGVSPSRIILLGPDVFDAVSALRLNAALVRRLQREPVSKIIGRRQFWGREFNISAAVLDPRPETETVIIEALKRPAHRVLDLGTGSGILAITLMAEWPAAQALATDISPGALAVARQNAARLGGADRIKFLQSDWFDAVEGSFDLIVANPPYISAAEMVGLEPDVRDYDPQAALSLGGDGFDAYRAIFAKAPAHISPQGRLIVEIGHRQAEAVLQLLEQAGFTTLACYRDLAGRDRVISAGYS